MRTLINKVMPVIAVLLIVTAGYLGLFVAPDEQHMGDVYRIIFVHVPSAWAALLAFTVTFIASVTYLFKSSATADALAEASAEIGVLFTAFLLITGSVWGKPTWGVWWTWDPRLTTAAIMLFAYLGYLALRRFVDVPEKRATWSAVVGIIVYVDIPIVWFSVKWWNTLHQLQSSGQSVAPGIGRPLMVGSIAFVALYLTLLGQRYRIARDRQDHADVEPPEVVHDLVTERA